MADNIKATWLKDKDGVKVAPATLTSQITDENGKGLDEILDNYINRPLSYAHIEDQIMVEQVNSLGIPSKWGYVESPCYIKKESAIPGNGSSVWFTSNSMAGAAVYTIQDAPPLIEGQEYLIEIDDQHSFAVCEKNGYELRLKFLLWNNTYVEIDNYNTLMFYGGNSGYHTLSLWKVKSKKLLDEVFLDKAYLEAPSYGYTGDFLKLDYSGKPVWTNMDTYLQSYIYNDDYATSSSGGIVQPNTSYGTTMVNNRYIAISPASTSNISAKTDNYKPLTSKNIDYIVKEGLGDSALTWTETEKTKARNVIGAASKDDIPTTKSSPYVIDSEAYTYGDDALASILSGKQLYVKVPSSSENSLYGNFMPVLQYQLPQNGNNYLTLFYLKDGIAQNLLAALTTGSFDGVFGEITMMLSQSYDECPLKVDPIK